MLGSHGTVLVVVPARGPATTCSQVMMAGAMTKMTTGRRVFLARKAIALDPSLPPSPIYPPTSLPSPDPAPPPIPSPYFCQPPIVWFSHCIVSFLVSSSILIYIYISINNCTYICTHTSTVLGPCKFRLLDPCIPTPASLAWVHLLPQPAASGSLGAGHDRRKVGTAVAIVDHSIIDGPPKTYLAYFVPALFETQEYLPFQIMICPLGWRDPARVLPLRFRNPLSSFHSRHWSSNDRDRRMFTRSAPSKPGCNNKSWDAR